MDCVAPSYEDLERLAQLIKQKTTHRPQIVVICGSGLGGLANGVQNSYSIPYADLPGFPISTVVGHKGQLVFGNIDGRSVVLMQGRCHMYEGYPAWKIAIPIRTLYILGVKVVIVTNAAGGVNATYKVGDIMVMKDHISFPCFSGQNPLVGHNDDRFGPRFPPMSDAYDKQLRRQVVEISARLGMDRIHEGVYCMLSGPMYETIAECKMLHMMGVDATGMSTVPEVIAARHCGMRVLGISMITNKVVTDYESTCKANHEEVLEAGKQGSSRIIKLIEALISDAKL